MWTFRKFSQILTKIDFFFILLSAALTFYTISLGNFAMIFIQRVLTEGNPLIRNFKKLMGQRLQRFPVVSKGFIYSNVKDAGSKIDKRFCVLKSILINLNKTKITVL